MPAASSLTFPYTGSVQDSASSRCRSDLAGFVQDSASSRCRSDLAGFVQDSASSRCRSDLAGLFFHDWEMDISKQYTLNRESLTCFVRTKPRGSVVITKPLASQRSLYASKASWLYYLTIYYYISLAESLCFTKGTLYLSLCKNTWTTTWHVCSRTYFVVINCISLWLFL